MPTEVTAGRIEALVSAVDDTALSAGRIEALASPVSDTVLTAGRIEVLSRDAFLLTAARIEALVIPPEALVSCANAPDSYFIVPDLLLVGESNVVSATSEQGPYPGAAAAGGTNLGRLLPLQSGRLTTDAESVVYRLQRAGGVDGAEYLWRKQSETASDFNGADDARRFRHWHAPTSDTTPGSDNCTTVYSGGWRRLVNITIDAATDTVTVAYRDVDLDRYDDWTTYTFTLAQAMPSGADHGAAAVELPDGRLLLMVSTAASASADFDAYASADGGLSWDRTARDVISRGGADMSVVGGRDDNSQIRMARSGEHIRLCWVRSATIVNAHSTDRGATWQFIDGAQVVTTVTGPDDPYPYDIVDVNDSGLFMLSKNRPTLTDMTVRFASGTADWGLGGATGDLSSLPGTVYQTICIRTSTWIYVWYYWSDTTTLDDDGWTFLRVLPSEANTTDTDDWQISEDGLPTWKPTGAFYTPTRVTAAWTGNEVWFMGGRKAEATNTDINRPLGWYWGGWHRYSMGDVGPTNPYGSFNDPVSRSAVWTSLWHVGQGQPSQGAGSPWVQGTVATGTDTLTMQYMAVSGTAAADQRTYSLTEAAGEWQSASLFYWTVRLDTGDSATTSDDVAVRIIADTGTGSESVDISLRHGPTGIAVYDNVGATTLETLTITGGIDTGSTGQFFEVRFWMERGGSTNYCQLMVFDTETREWFKTAILNPADDTTTTTTSDVFEFGHLGQVQATTMTSWWREVGILRESTGNMGGPTDSGTGFTNPTDLWGWPAASRAMSIEHGLEVAWGGSGGVEADVFDGAVERQHPAGALALASPRLDWRSEVPIAAATIILDADSVNGLDEWTHDAVAVFGTNSRTILIDYDDDVTFASPTTAESVDTTAFGATSFTVDSVGGLIIVADTATLNWVMGECAGLYIRMTSGTAIGLTFKVTAHRGLAILHCGDETTSLTSQGVAAADTFVMFRDHAALEYATPIGQGATAAQRYMRIRFTDTDTAEGDHRLGTLVVGKKLSISVPLDWAMTDNSQPNVTKYRTRSAVSWRFAEGPIQRTLTGRIVGDANRFRDRLRYVLSQLDYETRPVALVRDDERPDLAMLGRVTSGNQQDDAAWYRDSAGTLRTAGDTSLVFEEEV